MNIQQFLDEKECTGPSCQHETSKTHYLVQIDDMCDFKNLVLSEVEKEVEKILECSCNDCFDEKAELKLSINNLRVN